MSRAPVWKNASRCKICNSKFGIFSGGKHHCRHCGGTLCSGCSNQTMHIKKFGFTDRVRVCAPCAKLLVNENNEAKRKQQRKQQRASEKKRAVTTHAPKPAKAPAPTPVPVAVQAQVVCTCGMPLCVCPHPEEEKVKVVVEEKREEKKATKQKSKPRASSGGSGFSGFSGFGGTPTRSYNLNASKEQLGFQARDAVKNKDFTGLQKLLNAGASANFETAGSCLIHLAALFNERRVVDLLLQKGADPWSLNNTGETAVDLAPPSLAAYIKSKHPRS